MTNAPDIIATASPDEPETLTAENLDVVSAGAYGGSNSCEPYGGDNTCEPPAAGRAEFQTIPIERPESHATAQKGLMIK